jgi:hypothetical protein
LRHGMWKPAGTLAIQYGSGPRRTRQRRERRLLDAWWSADLGSGPAIRICPTYRVGNGPDWAGDARLGDNLYSPVIASTRHRKDCGITSSPRTMNSTGTDPDSSSDIDWQAVPVK